MTTPSVLVFDMNIFLNIIQYLILKVVSFKLLGSGILSPQQRVDRLDQEWSRV